MPENFIRTFDESGTWKSIEVKKDITRDEKWRIVVDTLSQEFDLEIIAKDSGYLRTSWKYTYVESDMRGKFVSDRYRSRIIIKFEGEDWKILRVKCESHWLDKRRRSWIAGFDTLILEEVYGDLQGRLARVRR